MKQILKDQRRIMKALSAVEFYLDQLDIPIEDTDAADDIYRCLAITEELLQDYFKTYKQ